MSKLKRIVEVIKDIGKFKEIEREGIIMYRKRQFCSECSEFTEQIWYEDERGLRWSYFQCSSCGSTWYLDKKTGKWTATLPWEYQEEKELEGAR